MQLSPRDLVWSRQPKSSRFLLTAVVPVSRMAGKLKNLQSWLASIAGLEINAIQVIIIHDIQDSETGNELKSLIDSLSTPMLQLIEVRAGSPGETRNVAKGRVEGRWLTFWDSDDLPQVDEFLRMVAAADAQRAEIAVGNFSRVNYVSHQETIHRIKEPEKSLTDQIFHDPGLWRFSFLVSKFEHSSFTNLLIGEDIIFLLEAKLEDFPIYMHPGIVYKYFVNFPNQATASNRAFSDYQNAIQYLILLNSCKVEPDVPFVIIKLALSASRRLSLRLVIKIWAKVINSSFNSPRTSLYSLRAILRLVRHRLTPNESVITSSAQFQLDE